MTVPVLDIPLSGPASLARLWLQQLRFGVAVAAAGDESLAPGTEVQLRLVVRWSGVRPILPARVESHGSGQTALRILRLPDAARKDLEELGLPDVATHVHPEPPPLLTPSPPPAPAPASSAPPPSLAHGPALSTAPVPAAPAAPPPGPAPAPTDSLATHPAARTPTTGSMPSISAFRPAAVAFRPPSAPAGPPSVAQLPAVGAPASAGSMRAVPSGPQPTSGSLPAVGGPTPTSPQLQAISTSAGPGRAGSESLLPPATEQGDFGSLSWRDVLLHFYTRRSTGVLVIHGFREVRWSYLLDGQPLHYRGDQPHAGEFLYDAIPPERGITTEEWTQALRLQQVTGLPAGEYLVARGRLSRADLDESLTRRATRITRYLLSANFGRFTFHPLEDLKMVFRHAPVDVLPLLLESQRQAYAALDDDALIKRCEPLYPFVVRLVASRAEILDRLPLENEERRLVTEVLPACWPLRELVTLKEMDERQLLRLVLALSGLGVIEVVRDEGEAARRNRVERKLYHAARDLRRRNAFECLHAHWSSSPREVDDGYRSSLKEYADGTFSDVLDARIRTKLQEIRGLVEGAWRKVGGVAARKEYRKGLVGADQLRMASDLLDKQAEMALFKGDFPLARACYERIVELDPGNDGGEVLNRAKAQLADERLMSAAELSPGAFDSMRARFDSLTDGD